MPGAGRSAGHARDAEGSFRKLVVVNLGYMPPGRKGPERVMPRGMPPEEVRRTIFSELQTKCGRTG